VVRSRHMRLDQFDPATLNSLFAEMRVEAEGVIRMGAPEAALTETRTAFMRYRGQGHEISVAMPSRPYTAEDVALLRKGFEQAYAALFSRIIPKLEVEGLTWSLALSTSRELPKPVADPPSRPAPLPIAMRRLLDPATGEANEAALHERVALAPGMTVPGPALIVEDGTTTIVPSGFTARVNILGQLILEAKS